jgi:hypothetical protein
MTRPCGRISPRRHGAWVPLYVPSCPSWLLPQCSRRLGCTRQPKLAGVDSARVGAGSAARKRDSVQNETAITVRFGLLPPPILHIDGKHSSLRKGR